MTHQTLKFNLLNIFRKEQFKNVQFVSMQIKLGLFPNGGKSLGNKYIIDLNDSTAIKNYVEYILYLFDTKFINSYDPEQVIKLTVLIHICNENEYASFSRRNKKFDITKIEVNSFLNMPFDTSYPAWGSSKIISKGKYKIKFLYNKFLLKEV